MDAIASLMDRDPWTGGEKWGTKECPLSEDRYLSVLDFLFGRKGIMRHQFVAVVRD